MRVELDRDGVLTIVQALEWMQDDLERLFEDSEEHLGSAAGDPVDVELLTEFNDLRQRINEVRDLHECLKEVLDEQDE